VSLNFCKFTFRHKKNKNGEEIYFIGKSKLKNGDQKNFSPLATTINLNYILDSVRTAQSTSSLG